MTQNKMVSKLRFLQQIYENNRLNQFFFNLTGVCVTDLIYFSQQIYKKQKLHFLSDKLGLIIH